jgi:hypothetical protein
VTVEHQAFTPGQMQEALDELQQLIQQRYPSAEFEVASAPDDPDIVHLFATVDVDDTEEVLDVVMERMLELQIEDGLPIYVIPVRPPERILQRYEADLARRKSGLPAGALLP